LAVPENVEIIAMIPLAYPDREPGPRQLKEQTELVHQEQW
jgi:hypothetical protein